MLRVLEVTGEGENKKAIEKWISEGQKAKSDIILSIHPLELSQIKNCKACNGIKLQNIYESKGPTLKATLQKQIFFTKIVDSVNRNEHINEFFSVVDKLKKMEIGISVDLLAILFLFL